MKKIRSLFVTFLLVFVTLFAGCQGNVNLHFNDASGDPIVNVGANVDETGVVNIDITGSAVDNNVATDVDGTVTDQTEDNKSDTVTNQTEDNKSDAITDDSNDIKNNEIVDDQGEDNNTDTLGEDNQNDVIPEDEAKDDDVILTHEAITVEEDGEYTDKEHVALYIHTFNHLPSNFITKKEAKELGWDSGKGNLGTVAPGKSIGGDRFGNREGNLPVKDGRQYYECDIDYQGKKRGAKRIVFSNDGLVYYTEDHYETFELLYE